MSYYFKELPCCVFSHTGMACMSSRAGFNSGRINDIPPYRTCPEHRNSHPNSVPCYSNSSCENRRLQHYSNYCRGAPLTYKPKSFPYGGRSLIILIPPFSRPFGAVVLRIRFSASSCGPSARCRGMRSDFSSLVFGTARTRPEHRNAQPNPEPRHANPSRENRRPQQNSNHRRGAPGILCRTPDPLHTCR